MWSSFYDGSDRHDYRIHSKRSFLGGSVNPVDAKVWIHLNRRSKQTAARFFISVNSNAIVYNNQLGLEHRSSWYTFNHSQCCLSCIAFHSPYPQIIKFGAYFRKNSDHVDLAKSVFRNLHFSKSHRSQRSWILFLSNRSIFCFNWWIANRYF